MAGEADSPLFWALVALWMVMAFTGWALSFGSGGGKKGPRRPPARWKLTVSRLMGVCVIVISVIFLLPFIIPGWEVIPPSYSAVTNGSIALFVGLGILMVARPGPAPGAQGPGPSPAGPVTGPVGHDVPVDPLIVEVAESPDGSAVPSSPPAAAAQKSGGAQTIACPQCGRDFDIVITSLPAAIKCPHCGVEGELE